MSPATDTQVQETDLSVQIGKLTLLIAACGLKGEALVGQLATLHPDFDLPDGLETLCPDTAAAILAEATARTDR